MMIVKNVGLAILLAALFVTPARASEQDELQKLLENFLATTHEKASHERFWAEDLVYTSSNGTRFGKTTILSGFEGPAAEDEGPRLVYSATDVDIRTFDDFAVVAFQLVGTPQDGTAVLNYFNTGTFQKRAGHWRAIAWQATVIPPKD